MLRIILQSFITRGIVAAINFLILLISARYLGVTTRGEISIFLLNILLIQVVNEVFTGYSIIHFVPRYNFRKLIVTGIIFSFIFCSASNIIIIAIQKQVPGYTWLPTLISFLVVINTFFCILILGKENLPFYNLLCFIQPFFLVCGMCLYIFVFKKFTFETYVYPLLFSFVVAIVISGARLVRYYNSSTTNLEFSIPAIVAKGLLFQGATFLTIVANRYTYYLLPDKSSVGIFSATCSLAESILIFSSSAATVLLSRMVNSTDENKNTTLTLFVLKTTFIASCFFVMILFMIPESFFLFLLGEGFVGIKDLIGLYGFVVPFLSIAIVLINYFVGTGQQYLVLIAYGLGVLSLFFLAPFLIENLGTKGAAYTALVVQPLIALILLTGFIVQGKISFQDFFSIRFDRTQIKTLGF